MYSDKKVLLIGGGGTIGTYVAKELLEMGCSVDIICLEDYVSDNEKLTYYKSKVDLDFLKEFLKDRYYNGILNLLHHTDPNEYIEFHKVIAPKTDHEIFFSSIRAIGDLQHPITETAPLLYDIVRDENYRKQYFDDEIGRAFIEKDDYSIPKAICEHYLHNDSEYKNWTIIRPMINTSEKRLDLIQYTFHQILEYAKEGKVMYLPEMCRKNVAGLEWAGNTGKMIANLMFKEECMGEVYLLSTGHRMTWEEVAGYYTDLVGLKTEWLETDEYLEKTDRGGFPLYYDRGYDRAADNAKILKATGLKKDDFTPMKDGIIIELKKLGAI